MMDYLCVQRDTVIRRKEVIICEAYQRKVGDEVKPRLDNI